MSGIRISIPPTADDRDVADLLERLGVYGCVPDNVIEIADEGDCWAVTSWIVEGRPPKVREVDGVRQRYTVRFDKARP